MTAYLGNGGSLSIEGVNVGQILSIDGPNIERAMVDTTNLGTTTLRTFVPGFGDGGEISVEVQYDHDDLGQEDAFESLIAGSSTSVTVVILLSDGDVYNFEAFIRSISHSQSMDEVNRSTIVFKVTGDVTHTPN